MSKLEAQMQAAQNEWIEGWKKGPQRLRWTKIPLQVGDQAPEFELPDSTGEMINLSSFWSEKPAMILFWRHYGCGCGIERAGMLQKDFKAFSDAGAQTVIIGQGEPERAAAYAAKYELPPIPILCDPDYTVYEAFGLVDGKTSQIMFDAGEKLLDRDLEAGMELARERVEMERPLVDNSWILPGEFVVDRGGEVRLAYRYNYCEDFPDYRVLTAAIREAVREGP